MKFVIALLFVMALAGLFFASHSFQSRFSGATYVAPVAEQVTQKETIGGSPRKISSTSSSSNSASIDPTFHGPSGPPHIVGPSEPPPGS